MSTDKRPSDYPLCERQAAVFIQGMRENGAKPEEVHATFVMGLAITLVDLDPADAAEIMEQLPGNLQFLVDHYRELLEAHLAAPHSAPSH